MKPEEKKLITKLISNGETEKAIEMLTQLLERSKTGKSHQATLVNISSRYHKFMEEKGRGILFKADEEVLQSRINNDLLSLLDQIEKPARPKPATAAAKPQPPKKETVKLTPPEKTSSGLAAWLWVAGIVVVAIVSYFIFTEKPLEVKFPKVCILNDLDSQCCPETYDRIRVQEAGRQLVVSVLLNKDLSDPYITGIVYDQNRNMAPIRQLSLTMNEGAICYSGLLHRTDASNWVPGQYTIEFSVNQQPAGSMNFTIIP